MNSIEGFSSQPIGSLTVVTKLAVKVTSRGIKSNFVGWTLSGLYDQIGNVTVSVIFFAKFSFH